MSISRKVYTEEFFKSLLGKDALVRVDYKRVIDWCIYKGYEDNDGKLSVIVEIDGEDVSIPIENVYDFEIVSFESECTPVGRLIRMVEELWSGEVVAKWSPPPGLFAQGTAEEIANTIAKASKSLKQAMSRINFYLNRAGKNISDERRKVIEKAKDIVRKLFEKK